MVDTIIEGQMTADELVELILEHYSICDTVFVWARIRLERKG